MRIVFFVEKPQRVETILFVISLFLLVYNLGQRELRNTLKRTSNFLKNQLGKLTNTLTLRWIFQCFQGVHFLTINQRQQVVNLTEERSLVLKFLPSSSSTLRCSWILKRLGIIAIAPGNYFSPLLL